MPCLLSVVKLYFCKRKIQHSSTSYQLNNPNLHLTTTFVWGFGSHQQKPMFELYMRRPVMRKTSPYIDLIVYIRLGLIPICSRGSPWGRHQMVTFSALLALCAGNSPVTGEFPSQRPVTRSFEVFCALIKCWVNNRAAGDLRRHRAHYDVIIMLDDKSAWCVYWIGTVKQQAIIWTPGSEPMLTQTCDATWRHWATKC